MQRTEIEKSLRRYLKRKMKYSFSLLIAFLITGGFSFASELTQEELLSRIKLERERLEELLNENERNLSELRKENMKLVKEADYYVKPEEATGVSLIGEYRDSGSVEKDWKGSARTSTSMDGKRGAFNSELSSQTSSGLTEKEKALLEAAKYTNTVDKRSSGWLNMSPSYSKNTNTYDAEARLFTMPVVNPPSVTTPTAPTVSFTTPTTPTELKISEPSIINISVGAISVNAPTVAVPTVNIPASPTAPTTPTVKVNEPNISIAIGAINVGAPAALNVPALVAPNVNVTVANNTPASIIPPNPQVSTPVAPAAPNFVSYLPGGGWWLNGHGAYNQHGYNNFDPNVLLVHTTAVKGGANDIKYNQTNIHLPLFATMNLNGNGATRGEIYAYRDASGAKTGYKNVTSPDNVAPYTPVYYGPTNGNNHNLPIDGSAIRPGYTAGTVLNAEIAQKNRWLLTNHRPTTIQNINFKFGGPDGTGTNEAGVYLTRNDSTLKIKDSKIELLGRTAISNDILHWGQHYQTSLELENVTIEIKGDRNTLYNNTPVSDQGNWSTADINAKFVNWGRPQRDDGTGKKGVFGKTDLGIDTKINTIFYVNGATSYRWNGYNGNNTTLSDGTVIPHSHVANPEALLVYTPLMGRVRYENKTGTTKGNFYFNGSGNVGAWVVSYTPDRTKYAYNPASGPGANSPWSTDEAPIIDLGKVHMTGDGNVGIYLASHRTRPDYNGIFQGRLPIDFEIGLAPYKNSNGVAGTAQLDTGNTDGDNTKSSGNVALYVASGQRKELTVANGYFPATTNLLAHSNTNYYGTGIGTSGGTQVGYPDLNTPAHAIKDLTINDFNVKFGKYSKNNIAIVARNGSVVELSPNGTITDGQNASTADIDRADGTIIAFAEGVWFNPRPAKIGPNDGTKITSAAQNVSHGVVTDGRAGQKYVPQYGSAVKVSQNMELGSKNAVAVFAKDGAAIDAKGIKIYGAGSTAAFALGTKKWSSETLESDTTKGGGTSAASNIKIDGDIELTKGDKNRGAVAISRAVDNKGNVSYGDGANITVTGKLNVNGLGAYANGTNTSVTISGSGSTLTSGADGSLVALNGGVVKINGGTINHSVSDQLPFYSANGAKLDFTGKATLNIYKGVLFYGEESDFGAASGGSKLYNGMGNLTVELKDHGVNLGVFKGVTNAEWLGNTSKAYTDALKLIPKVAAINGSDTYWYKSSLEGGQLTIKHNVDRDKISSGSFRGDGFNDIVMERTKVIIDKDSSGNNIEIKSLNGRTMAIASNSSANSNIESGYTIKNGTIDISNNTAATTGAYVDFGHINLETNGNIKVSRGVAAYGVNGSSIKNEGNIIATDATASQNIGIVALAQKQGINPPTTTQDDYGKVVGKGSANKWAEVINKGKIEIAGKDAIGIYMKNNYDGTTTPGTVTTAVPKSEMLITNNGTISVGENGKAIVIQSTHKEGGTLTLKDSGTKQDITVGKNGIGVYTEHSDIKFDGNYGMAIGEGGVAIQMAGNSNITTTGASDVLTVEYKGTANGTAMALGYEEQLIDSSTSPKTTTSFQNNLNIKLENTGNAKTLVGLYASKGANLSANDSVSGKLTNNGNIESKHTGSYGILSKGVEVVNTGVITVGDAAKTTSEAVGIYVEDAALTTDGDKIKIEGHGTSTAPSATPIGIYAKATSVLGTGSAKTIAINKGTSAMEVNGKNAIGIYLEDAGSNNNEQLILKNSSDIDLADSSTTSERKIGILTKNNRNLTNETSGTIKVKKNNIGIYNDNSILTHSGTLEVKHNENGTENIGVHNKGNDFVFNVIKSGTNSGKIDVEGRNSTIGISAATTGTDKGEINLTNAQILVKANSLEDGKIPLGIYAKGNNISINSAVGANQTKFTVSPNAVGAYLEGDNTTSLVGNYKFNLSSENTKAKVAVGTFFKGGSFAKTNSEIKIESTLTATNADGSIRPIGLFYGENSTKNEANIEIVSTSREVIGMYGKDLTTGANNFTNTGKIDVNAKGIGAYFSGTNVANQGVFSVTAAEGYGLYLQGGNSFTTANMTASGKSSIATLVSGTGAKFENRATISATEDKAVGVYVENGAEFINTGTLKSDVAANLPAVSGSIGAFALNAKITNDGAVNSKNVGLYGTNSSTITNTGTINIANGVGILANDKSTVNGTRGSLTGLANGLSGIIAQNNSTVNLAGSNISLTGNKSIGISLDGTSKAVLTTGNVTVGAEGLGLYSKNSSVDLTSYNGTFNIGNKGIAMYADNSTVSAGTLNVNYNGANTGVGIYYKGGTSQVNNTIVNHTGSKLVNIFSEGITLTNKAAQTVQTNGIGIYAKGGEIVNEAMLTLAGDKTVGVFLDNGAKLNMTSVGNITGGAATTYKVGVYAKNGVIEGSQNYNFGVNNGVALYLDNNGTSTYTGTLNLTAASESGKRAIGVYTAKSATPKNITANINVSGADALGLFLEGDATGGSTVNYGGTLDITSASTADYGIGALVQNKSTFNLTSTGKVKIGGTNNIGFYVQEGGNLQVSGGTVENTADGIFAYLDKGKLHFTKGTTPNINFLNVFVTGTGGEIKNETKILVGTKGLQAAAGAKIENTATGVINATVDGARALVGTGAGTTVQNSGNIKLEGKESVALYITDNATATSSGSVEIGKNSVAYYAKDNGLINVSGTTVIGEGSSLFFVDKGRINYTGADIVLPNKTTALTLAGAPATVNFNNKNITVGENGAGIYLTKNGELNTINNSVQNLAKINVNKNASGIFIGNAKNFESAIAIDLIDENALGIYSTGSGNLAYTGNINSNKLMAKGIVHIGAGDTTNTGTVKLLGDASIGVYAKNGGVLTNSGTVEISKGVTKATSVGLYGENLTEIKNTHLIKMQENAIGIYGKNTKITNTGTIANAGRNNNGIYAIESDVENSGTITLGDSSNGIYVSSATGKTITNNHNITVGGVNSAALFADGNTKIINNAGTLTTGAKSVAIASIGGNITVENPTKFNVGEKSTYIYSETGTGINKANISLSDYSIGMYTKNGKMTNEGSITVGTSLVTSATTDISVAMATERGEVINDGTILVPKKWGVGMLANGKDGVPTDPRTAINNGTIKVDGELAYGMMAANESTLINNNTIIVNGKKARGMAATENSTIINSKAGVITVNGEDAQGIYVDGGSKVDNQGTINVNGVDRTGIFNGGGTILNKGTINISGGATASKEASTKLEVGKIKIDGPKVIFNGVEVINSGAINIPEALDLGTLKIGTTAGNIGTINSKTFGKGEFIVLPNSTLGTNKDAYTIQYLGGFKNLPNNGELSAISHSVSFIADIQNDVSDPANPIARIVLARIPYAELTAGTKAIEFGKGLDELYKNLGNKDPKAPEFQIFDALKMISDKDELGSTFDKELRGNVYANVQRRMLEIGDTFTTSYNNLKNNELYAKSRFKAGAIITGGKSKDKNAGVEDYKSNTLGTIVMYEKDYAKYGRSTNVSLGFTETKFDFDLGSKEKVYSLHLGVGYEDLLVDNKLKYSTRGQLTISQHNMKRKIHLSNGVFENKGKYWSEMVEWKNMLRYEIPTVGGRLTAGVFGTFDLGYGKFKDINENGDGVELKVKSENIHSIRPGIGADMTLRHYTESGKISLVGTATAEYELGKIYDGVNQVKIKNSSAGYYDLEKAKEIKDIYKLGVQLQYETNSGHKLGLGVVREEGSIRATRYGVNLMYKF